jgi:DNA-binding CsgD family transcriptional regulator
MDKKLQLGPREKQLLRRLAAGKTDAEMAVRLGGSCQQVSKHRAHLLDKLKD